MWRGRKERRNGKTKEGKAVLGSNCGNHQKVRGRRKEEVAKEATKKLSKRTWREREKKP